MIGAGGKPPRRGSPCPHCRKLRGKWGGVSSELRAYRGDSGHLVYLSVLPSSGAGSTLFSPTGGEWRGRRGRGRGRVCLRHSWESDQERPGSSDHHLSLNLCLRSKLDLASLLKTLQRLPVCMAKWAGPACVQLPLPFCTLPTSNGLLTLGVSHFLDKR